MNFNVYVPFTTVAQIQVLNSNDHNFFSFITVVCEISLIVGLHMRSLHLWSKLHAKE